MTNRTDVLATPSELLGIMTGSAITLSTLDGTEVVVRLATAEEFRELHERGRRHVESLVGTAPPSMTDAQIADIVRPLDLKGLA